MTMTQFFKKAITKWQKEANKKGAYELRSIYVAEWGKDKALFNIEYVIKSTGEYKNQYIEVKGE